MATLTLNGSTSGNVVVTVPAISGTGNTVTIPATTGTLSVASTSTSGGIFFGGATSGVLYQDASNLYWDDTNNRLGIGNASPVTSLDVTGIATIRNNSAAFNTTPNTNYGLNFQAASSGVCYLTSYSSGGSTSIVFATNDSGGAAAERMRVLSTGNILSLSGGSTTATGTGIAFPATQSASSDVNTLDDYEEGTWTPVVSFNGASVGMVYTSFGSYVKIGSLVYVYGKVSISNKGSSTGTARLNGLPFTINSNNQGTAPAVYIQNGQLVAGAGNVPQLYGNPGGAAYDINSYIQATGADSNLTNTAFGTTGAMYITAVYNV